jgi:DNA repair protein RadA/Sms
MAKLKTTFFCQNCGSQYAKWQGQCNACKEWNTIVEEIIQKEEKVAWKATTEVKKAPKPLKLSLIHISEPTRR